jgi:hypothetical protein
MGISNGVGTLSGMVCPIIVGAMTKHKVSTPALAPSPSKCKRTFFFFFFLKKGLPKLPRLAWYLQSSSLTAQVLGLQACTTKHDFIKISFELVPSWSRVSPALGLCPLASLVSFLPLDP